MDNKFIQPARTRPAPRQPAQPQQGQQSTPRRVVEELGTQSFEFPQPRGPRPGAAIIGTPPEARPQTAPSTPEPVSKSHAETDPEFFTIDLPSNFEFYGFKQLACRTLKASHQAKFSRANKEQKLRYSVEAISATLEPGLSAFDLTPSDFYFLMYWQKVNSFQRNPMIVTVYCDNTDHNHSVHIGDEVSDEENEGKTKIVKMPEESLKTETVLTNTTLETKVLPPVFKMPSLSIVSKYDLHVETMRDVVEATEYIIENDVNEEDLFHQQYAVFLRRLPDEKGLKRRMDIVAQMDPHEIEEMDEYIKHVTAYGVSEHAMIKCKGCGAPNRVKISFDALSFLPNGR